MTKSNLRCTRDGTIVDLREQVTRQQVQLGDRVAIAVDDRITRELWHAPGRVTQVREYPYPQKDYYYVEFDEPTKSVGVWMTGLWAQASQLI